MFQLLHKLHQRDIDFGGGRGEGWFFSPAEYQNAINQTYLTPGWEKPSLRPCVIAGMREPKGRRREVDEGRKQGHPRSCVGQCAELSLSLSFARVSIIGWKSLRDPADRFPTTPPTTVTGFLSNPFFASSSIFPLSPRRTGGLLSCFPYKIRDGLVRATRRTCAYASPWTTIWKGPGDEEGITKDSFDTLHAPKRQRVDANRMWHSGMERKFKGEKKAILDKYFSYRIKLDFFCYFMLEANKLSYCHNVITFSSKNIPVLIYLIYFIMRENEDIFIKKTDRLLLWNFDYTRKFSQSCQFHVFSSWRKRIHSQKWHSSEMFLA